MKFNLKRFIVALLDKMFLPVPVEPPALPEEPITEKQLRAMYNMGVTAERERVRKEQEKAIALFPVAQPTQPLSLQDAVAMIRTSPLSHETGPIVRRAGGLMHAQRAKARVQARLEARILPARPNRSEPIEKRPIFASVPTRIEFSAVLKRDLPDAG